VERFISESEKLELELFYKYFVLAQVYNCYVKVEELKCAS
jgi:hypothetical protein